jgi:uracil-DNA glycosylase
MALLPADRLVLLVGAYAQGRYLPRRPRRTLTEQVRAFRDHGPRVITLPHPAWRVTLWMERNPWFAAELLPVLKAAVREHLPSPGRPILQGHRNHASPRAGEAP